MSRASSAPGQSRSPPPKGMTFLFIALSCRHTWTRSCISWWLSGKIRKTYCFFYFIFCFLYALGLIQTTILVRKVLDAFKISETRLLFLHHWGGLIYSVNTSHIPLKLGNYHVIEFFLTYSCLYDFYSQRVYSYTPSILKDQISWGFHEELDQDASRWRREILSNLKVWSILKECFHKINLVFERREGGRGGGVTTTPLENYLWTQCPEGLCDAQIWPHSHILELHIWPIYFKLCISMLELAGVSYWLRFKRI